MEIKEIQNKVLEIMLSINTICKRNNIDYSLAYGGTLGAVRHRGFIPWDPDMDIIIPLDQEEKFRTAMQAELPDNMDILIWENEYNYHPCFDRIIMKGFNQEEVHVDVFSLCGLPNNPIKRKLFIYECFYAYHILSCRVKNPNYSKKKNRWKVKIIKKSLFFISEKQIKCIYYSLKHRYPFSEATDTYNIATGYKNRDITKKSVLYDTIQAEFENCKFPIPREYDMYLTQLYGDYMIPVKYE